MAKAGIQPGPDAQRSKARPAGARSRFKFPASRLVAPLLSWFAQHARDLPWRRTLDPYAVWVSEIMLQQTQVRTVIPYFERWMRDLPTIESLANASSEKIHKLWEGLGYYTRVRNMQSAARLILEKHDRRFPTQFSDVLALPGIGRYTAGAVCSIAFNQPTPILDGNVIRVLTRLFGIRDNARAKKANARLWELARQLVSNASTIVATSQPTAGSCSALNQSLMELGATVCTPRQPRCEACPLARRCAARHLGLIESVPNLGDRVPATERRFLACVLECDGAMLVRQRPGGMVNAHLWEFPNVETGLQTSATNVRKHLETELGCALAELTPITTVKHTITRYRITLEAFRSGLNGPMPRADAGRWIATRELEKLPFTSAHRRLLRSLSGGIATAAIVAFPGTST